MSSNRFELEDWDAASADADPFHAVSYVRGVSLSGVLQMLHLERKTCVLEVVSGRQFGTLTLVNGELVDAGAGELDGEDAVYRILAWPQPRTTILDGVNLFRHSVGLPLSRLLVELVRRQDERESTQNAEQTADGVPAAIQPALAGSIGDWTHLVESMVISGALAAAVWDSDCSDLLALADEFGGSLDGLSAAVLTDLIPMTTDLVRWLQSGDADDLVVHVNDLHLLLATIEPGSSRIAFALLDSTECLDRVRSACRVNSAS